LTNSKYSYNNKEIFYFLNKYNMKRQFNTPVAQSQYWEIVEEAMNRLVEVLKKWVKVSSSVAWEVYNTSDKIWQIINNVLIKSKDESLRDESL